MNRPDDELLSAYLDGEVTADEQAEVERLLAASPAARRLLDELRALSATLQALPQEKVGIDLSEQILHAAQRRILTGQQEPPQPASRAVLTWLRGRVTRRALAWPAVAVGMALVIMLLDRSQPDRERPVAAVHETREKARESKVAKESQLAPARDLDREPPRMSARRELAEETKPPAVDGVDERLGDPAGPERFGGMATKPSGKRAEQVAGLEDGSRTMEDRRNGEVETMAKKGVAATPDADWRDKSDYGRFDESNKTNVAGGAQPAPMADVNKVAANGPRGGVIVENGEGGGLGGAMSGGTMRMKSPAPGMALEGQKAEGLVAEADPKQKQLDADSDAGILVVQCDVGAAATTTDAFVRLLADHQITFTEANGDFANGAMRDAETLRQDLKQQTEKEKKLRGVAKDSDMAARGKSAIAANDTAYDAPMNDRLREGQDSKRLPGGDGLELVYVEATPTQINGVLASMAKAHELYYAVSVEPAPGASAQEKFRSYTRRGDQRGQVESREADGWNEGEGAQAKERGEKTAVAAGTTALAQSERAGRAWRIAALNGGQVTNELGASGGRGRSTIAGIAVPEVNAPGAKSEPTQMARGAILPAAPLDHIDGKMTPPKADAPATSVPATPPPTATAPAPLVLSPVAPSVPVPAEAKPQSAPAEPMAPVDQPAKPAEKVKSAANDMAQPESKSELAKNDLPKGVAGPGRASGGGAGRAVEELPGPPVEMNAGMPAIQPGIAAAPQGNTNQLADQVTGNTYRLPGDSGGGLAGAPLGAPAPPAPPPGKAPAKYADAPAITPSGGTSNLRPDASWSMHGVVDLAPGQVAREGGEPVQRVLFVLRAVPAQVRSSAALAAPAAKPADPARPHAAELERSAKPAAEAAPAQK